MSYRVVGVIEAQLDDFSWDQPDAAKREMKAVEEFAAECSIIKVYASEMLDYVVDEGVQIHGGYGYQQEYAVERAYRDSRINRIFEGTNEINRLLTTGMLLKRAMRGQLGLVKAAQAVMAEILSGPSRQPSTTDDEPWAEEKRLVANAKKIALLLLGLAFQKFMMELEKQQEILSAAGGRDHRRVRHGIGAAAHSEAECASRNPRPTICAPCCSATRWPASTSPRAT